MNLRMLEHNPENIGSLTTQDNSNQRRLTAKWLIVDKKLVCKWIVS